MSNQINQYNQIDPAIETRVEALLQQMTLAEKVGQLVQITPSIMPDPDQLTELLAKVGSGEVSIEALFKPRPDLEELIRTGSIGSLLNMANPQQINQLQRIAVEESRLGIPLIVGSDVIHGFRTIFPIPLAEACTWNPELLEQASRVAATEAAAAGIDWIFAPMVDNSRDPRWGRVAEGSGEDVFLGGVMAEARVRGFQTAVSPDNRNIAACPKHYVGYGASEAGRDYNPTELTERTLREVHLPPFAAAFAAGAGSVMSAFNDISGVPASANPFTLKTVLRDEWQWPGVVLSDFGSIAELVLHGVAADLKEAARLAILAGVDMDMMNDAYGPYLAELVAEGSVPEAVVDESVRRVLRLKLALGLFERPFTDETLLNQTILSDGARQLALEVAQQSIVLLKNEGDLLPLSPAKRVAVIGPLADARRDMLGMWTLFGKEEDAETVLEGVGRYAVALTHAAGCSLTGSEGVAETAVLAAVDQADVVLLVVGEGANMSGEARSRSQLGLPGQQQALADLVAQTGKPLVVVLMGGRPLIVPRLLEQADAVLMAWHGGICAGRAVADIVFGAVNPSGKLTMSWPRREGQIPVYYSHKSTGRPMTGEGVPQFGEPFKSRYIDLPNEPQFPFGFGGSYTTFEYADLVVEKTAVLPPSSTLVVSATVCNSGSRAGTEVVQLYIRDLVGSVTRPVKELKGFQRITLQPGEAQQVRFELPIAELAFWDAQMQHRVEPGEFQVWIGPNAASGLVGSFAVVAGD